jgi:hypothetical protein
LIFVLHRREWEKDNGREEGGWGGGEGGKNNKIKQSEREVYEVRKTEDK